MFIKDYVPNKLIKVNDKMQKRYSYRLVYKAGTNLTKGGVGSDGKVIKYTDFKPYFSPKQMISMGVFEGKYLNDCFNELPIEWYRAGYKKKKLSLTADAKINYFGIKSRLSLQEWKRRGWIPVHEKDKDIRGWFQWYCRYWLGRRIPEVDEIQIKRWKAFKRHSAQVLKNAPGQLDKRKKQRQALLQWSWNCFI